jgi:hypothetical protein
LLLPGSSLAISRLHLFQTNVFHRVSPAGGMLRVLACIGYFTYSRRAPGKSTAAPIFIFNSAFRDIFRGRFGIGSRFALMAEQLSAKLSKPASN